MTVYSTIHLIDFYITIARNEKVIPFPVLWCNSLEMCTWKLIIYRYFTTWSRGRLTLSCGWWWAGGSNRSRCRSCGRGIEIWVISLFLFLFDWRMSMQWLRLSCQVARVVWNEKWKFVDKESWCMMTTDHKIKKKFYSSYLYRYILRRVLAGV